ncbi:MAG: glycosyltransferase, partial [Planctomycetes bacterium]|nr:glycosyltransferase [Planctomycetota bacterium]
MTQFDLSIVIPAFNEHTKIAQDIRKASAFLTEAGLTGEILVVDDGSTDPTADVAKQTPVRGSVQCRVITLTPNQGK